MHKFPAEFAELLNDTGKRLMEEKPRPPAHRLLLSDAIIDPATARDCVKLLDRHLYTRLRPMVQRIPPSATWGMKKNYSEKLPKTVSVKTCHLRSRRALGYAEAEKMGLLAMLHSETLHRFAEAGTGLKLECPGAQAICYEHGDYSGPHNDHHPQDAEVRDGFVDLHIMFANDAVAHHWLVYEEKGHLRNIVNINLQGAVSLYRLPFWHYTTPLAAKPGREREARRWLVMVSFNITKRRAR